MMYLSVGKRIVVVTVLLASFAPQCSSDDDKQTGSGGASGIGDGYHVIPAGGATPDTAPSLCDVMLQGTIEQDQTFAASKVVDCALALAPRPASFVELFVYVDCYHLTDAWEADGGRSWSYRGTENEIVFGDATCERLKADPTRRIDVIFYYGDPK